MKFEDFIANVRHSLEFLHQRSEGLVDDYRAKEASAVHGLVLTFLVGVLREFILPRFLSSVIGFDFYYCTTISGQVSFCLC